MLIIVLVVFDIFSEIVQPLHATRVVERITTPTIRAFSDVVEVALGCHQPPGGQCVKTLWGRVRVRVRAILQLYCYHWGAMWMSKHGAWNRVRVRAGSTLDPTIPHEGYEQRVRAGSTC